MGYNTSSVEGIVYKALGPTFVDVGSTEGTFTLNGTLAVGDGYDWGSDKMYLVNPESNEADLQIVNIAGNWYDELGGLAPCGDEEFDIGTGFQTDFSGTDFTVTSSGAVFGDGYTIDCNEKVYQFIVNATGRSVSWSEITVDGDYDWGSDKIYIINPESNEADNQLVNIAGAWYDELAGLSPYDEELAPSEGFQTDFSGNDIQINFPTTFDAE